MGRVPHKPPPWTDQDFMDAHRAIARLELQRGIVLGAALVTALLLMASSLWADDATDRQIKIIGRAGGQIGLATDVKGKLDPAIDLTIIAPTAKNENAPDVIVSLSLTSLPDDRELADISDLGQPQTFKAFNVDGRLSQPLGETLRFRLYAMGGLASKLSTSDEPRDRLPAYGSFGVEFRTKSGDNTLLLGMGPDQRLSGDTAVCVHLRGAVRIDRIGKTGKDEASWRVYLTGSIIRALDLSAYGYATPVRDFYTFGVVVGR